MTADDIWNIFDGEYVSKKAPYKYVAHKLAEDSSKPDAVEVHAEVVIDGDTHKAKGVGNGPIDAFVAAIASELHAPVKVMDYHEHAIGQGRQRYRHHPYRNACRRRPVAAWCWDGQQYRHGFVQGDSVRLES